MKAVGGVSQGTRGSLPTTQGDSPIKERRSSLEGDLRRRLPINGRRHKKSEGVTFSLAAPGSGEMLAP